MKYYLEITLLPDAESSLGFIWHKLYQQVHLMLAEHKVAEHDSAIGVSFPLYGAKDFPLGNKLRLFAATQAELDKLNVQQWLCRLSDYLHVKAAKAVPDEVQQYACFSRRQFKSPAKLLKDIDGRANYLAAKNGFEKAAVKTRLIEQLQGYKSEFKSPYISIKSLSSEDMNAKVFKLFIERRVFNEPVTKPNHFTCYGLSRRNRDEQMTVPLF